MTKYLYTTSGTCSKAILLTVEGDILTDAAYLGGCQGNTQGIQPAGGRNALEGYCRAPEGHSVRQQAYFLSGSVGQSFGNDRKRRAW